MLGGSYVIFGGMRGFGRAASLYCSSPETSVGRRDTSCSVVDLRWQLRWRRSVHRETETGVESTRFYITGMVLQD